METIVSPLFTMKKMNTNLRSKSHLYKILWNWKKRSHFWFSSPGLQRGYHCSIFDPPRSSVAIRPSRTFSSCCCSGMKIQATHLARCISIPYPVHLFARKYERYPRSGRTNKNKNAPLFRTRTMKNRAEIRAFFFCIYKCVVSFYFFDPSADSAPSPSSVVYFKLHEIGRILLPVPAMADVGFGLPAQIGFKRFEGGVRIEN